MRENDNDRVNRGIYGRDVSRDKLNDRNIHRYPREIDEGKSYQSKTKKDTSQILSSCRQFKNDNKLELKVDNISLKSSELTVSFQNNMEPKDPKFEINIANEEEHHEIDIDQLESFMKESISDEDEKVEKLAQERKRRRQEILDRYKQNNTKHVNAVNSHDKAYLGDEGLAESNEPMIGEDKILPEPLLGFGSLNDSDATATIIPQKSVDAFDTEAEQLLAEKYAIKKEEEQNKKLYSAQYDMFSATPTELERQQHAALGTAAVGAGAGRVRGLGDALEEGQGQHLQHNWDDGEGYYRARIGEVLQDRFRTLGVVGKGVFSTVLKCVDTYSAPDTADMVAIKMVRNNDTMRKAAEKERAILQLIAAKDPLQKKNCVILLHHFDFRNHTAFAFAYQQMNLRETLKKYGKDVGLNIGAVRLYSRQLLVALRHLADLRVVHADIKLDNILCSADLKHVTLCDFGSAFFETDSDNAPTPYLVSRFYRAPEIILGLPYDRLVDLWAVGVCLFELFTGHVMFPGRTNNEMLRLQMALRGRFPNKVLKLHQRQYETMNLEPHFDSDLRFRQWEQDPVSGKALLRLVDVTAAARDMPTVLRSAKAGADDGRLVSSLTHLLEQCLQLDPAKRIAVSDALKHPLFGMK